MSGHAVVLRCDAGGALGIGHLIRCLALAEELLARGCRVDVRGTVADSSFAERQITDRGLSLHPASSDPEVFTAQCLDSGVSGVVLDGYEIAEGMGHALRAAGLSVLSIHDGSWGLGQEADVYLDQNLGAVAPAPPDIPADAVALAGPAFTCFRDNVRQRRPAAPRPSHDPVRVLAFFGGTDVFEAAPVLVPLILGAGVPVHVHAVAARADLAERLRAIEVPSGSYLQVHGLVDDLPGLAVECDAVVSAAGTSTWEMLSLGVPAALVAVTANQLTGYDIVVSRQVVAPLGLLDPLRSPGPAANAAVTALRQLLSDSTFRRNLAARGMELFDGAGRERVATAFLSRLPGHREARQ